jgi:hypothetical protein
VAHGEELTKQFNSSASASDHKRAVAETQLGKMKKHVPPSRQECDEVIARIKGKSLGEIINILGAPTRELKPFKEQRVMGDQQQSVEFLRILEFSGVAPTVSLFWVYLRADGRLEFRAHGRDIETSNA